MENDTNPVTSETNTPLPETSETSKREDKTTSTAFDFSQTPIMAALSYMGPLVVIPLLTSRDNPFVLFHLKQGLVLFVLLIVLSLLHDIFDIFEPLVKLVELGAIILCIIGIVNSLQNKTKEVPIVGKFAENIKL